MNDPEALIERAKAYVTRLFAFSSGGHGADHTLRVYRTALRLLAEEPEADPLVTALAALLHDADDPKLFSTENNENARTFLREAGAPPETVEAVCRAVNSVSFSRNGLSRPDTPEGRIVQDADRLDALGAVGAARTFAYGGEHGRSLADSVRQFDEKLLLLRDGMNTSAGRAMAEDRHAFLITFLRQYRKETEVAPSADA